MSLMSLPARPIVVAVLIAALAACQTTPGPSSRSEGSADVATARTGAAGTGLTARMNAVRSAAGRAPVQRSARLDAIARAHARDMARRNYFDHRSPEGQGLPDRLRARGYSYCYAAENIAWGRRSEAETFAGWMASPSHRRNILNPRAERFGHAAVPDPDGSHQMLWVMVLAAGC